LPRLIEPKQDRQPELTRRHQQLLLTAEAGALDPQQFTERGRAELFPDKAKELHSELSELGSLKSFFLLDETTSDPERRRVRH
jgi:hypothetical protein